MRAAVVLLLLTAGIGFLPATTAQAAPTWHAISTAAVATPMPPQVAGVTPSIVQVQARGPTTRLGSSAQSPLRVGLGIAVAGGVLASDRIVGDADQAQVATADGQRDMAQVAWRSPIRDLVLLQTSLTLQPAKLEAATQQDPNEAVAVLGYEQDAQGNFGLAVTSGELSGVQRDQEGVTFVQLQTRMDPGFVGGAVFNMRGQVVGGPSLSTDGATGMTLAVGGEEAQALLSQPQPAATSAATYQGDGQDLLPVPTDVGPGWQAAPLPPQAPSGPSTASVTSATERLVNGDPSADSGPLADLRPVVLVAPDAEHARWAWERGLRHPPSDVTRLPDPPVASVCHAYLEPSADGRQDQVVVVACQEANVAFGVSIAGEPELATPETASRLAGLMAQRIRAAAP